MTATDLRPPGARTDPRTDPQADSRTEAADLAGRAAAVAGDAGRAIELARSIGPSVPLPGGGDTFARWTMLRTLAAADLTAARVVEAHTDALAILAEAAGAGLPAPDSAPDSAGDTWGVFAAEGPGVRVDAVRAAGEWRLTGTKPWCSLAGRLDRALITAHVSDGRRLFAVDLRTDRVRVDPPAGWAARGLVEVPSTAVHLDRSPGQPVGPAGWYLTRPGFAWGGMGVAACWLGGVDGIARALHAAARRRDPDQIALMHLGAIDADLAAADALLRSAAAAIDNGSADGPDGARWAARVRAVVARLVDGGLRRVGHALGPAPLAFDDDHARRVADLQLYVRQQHAERDDAALGAMVRDLPQWP